MIFKKTGKLVLASLLIAGLFLAAGSALAEVTEPHPEIKWAQDLSAISELSENTIILLYDSIGDKEYIQENVFLINRIFRIADDYGVIDLEVYQQLREVQIPDLLAAYELVQENDLKVTALRKMIDRISKGEKADIVMVDSYVEEKHKVYLPANKEQIRKWLNNGFIVEDVLRADTIAMSLDLETDEVISLKTDDISWEEIEAKLGYIDEATNDLMDNQLTESQSLEEALPVKEKLTVDEILNMKSDVSTNDLFSLDDFDELTIESKKFADEKKEEKIKELKAKKELSDEQFDLYLGRGFNPYEIENAIKLSKGDSKLIDEILGRVQDDESWEDVIATYSSSKEAKDD